MLLKNDINFELFRFSTWWSHNGVSCISLTENMWEADRGYGLDADGWLIEILKFI